MRGKIATTLRSAGLNLGLLGTSLAVTLIGCELFLRLFFPRYQYAAESQAHRDSVRIWSRVPNSREFRSHPDTGIDHPVYT